MRGAELAFREDHDLLDECDWNAYVDAVGEDWLQSQDFQIEYALRSPRERSWDDILAQSDPSSPRRRKDRLPPSEKLRRPRDLTAIEDLFYEALGETGLTFSTQTWIQHTTTRYRLDFLIYYDGRGVAVELDGHDSHKTKDQRGYDNTRANWLMARGIRVVRFTGSQVSADPDACVRTLLDVLRESQARP